MSIIGYRHMVISMQSFIMKSDVANVMVILIRAYKCVYISAY